MPMAVLAANKLGASTQAPQAPVFIYQSLHDEVVPFQTVDNLVNVWGQNGKRLGQRLFIFLGLAAQRKDIVFGYS